MKKILVIDKAKNTNHKIFEKIIDKFDNTHYYLYVNYQDDTFNTLTFNNISVTRINNILNIFKEKFDIIVFISYTMKGLRYTNQLFYGLIFLKSKIFCQNLLDELVEISRIKILYLMFIHYLYRLILFLFTLPLNLIIIIFRFLFFIKQSVCNLLSNHIKIFKNSKNTN